MSRLIRKFAAFAIGSVLMLLPLSATAADDGPEDQSPPKTDGAQPKTGQSQSKAEPAVPEISLLDAAKQGLISVQAEGIGDGRMNVTLKNLTKKQLHVILPPGLVAQGATGQFGGMGGMGGGMGGMGGGMGGMGGGMGGMGGGMGGMGGMGGAGGGGMSGGMGGSMGRPQTMPPTMGMMMLARMVMYFCGDPSSWDQRSLMIGMMGGMGMGGMGGGMGGMGGGMGGMGGMGGGMRSVPPTDLPFALLNPNQVRSLPTRLVSVSQPDPDAGLSFPEKGEPLKVGDISQISDRPRVQKALRRLAAEKAPTTLSQLVMWNLSAGLDWATIHQLSQQWANRFELTLAQDFVDRLDTLPEGETGRLLFQIDGSEDAASSPIAAELSSTLKGKLILGLVSYIGIPERPEGPAVACKVRLTGKEALVQVTCSDAAGRSWVPFGKFSLPLVRDKDKPDVARLSDSLAESLLNRLVRIQMGKGTKDSGKLMYPVKIENFSPLILNGVAVVGTTSKPDEIPKVLSMICVSPRKSMTVPASDEVVRTLGLKKGIKVVALDLSGL